MAGMDTINGWTQQHGIPLTKIYIAMTTACCPICQQQNPTMSPQYGTIPQGNQPTTWWQIDNTGHFHHSRAILCFVLIRICTYSGHRFAFPEQTTSVKTTEFTK